MKVRLSNTKDHDHERVVKGLALLLHRKPETIVTDLIEVGLGTVMMAAHERGDAVAHTLGALRDADPELMEAARQIWAAGTQGSLEASDDHD